MPRLITAAAAALLLAGCTVGPRYERPELALPDSFAAPLEGGEVAGPAELARWWEQFNDPTLNNLVAAALEANHDLRIAGARLREARAARGIVAAERYPALDARAAYTRSRTPEVDLPGAAVPFLGAGPSPDRGQDLYEAAFDARWELDLFGSTRRALEAAEADIAAAAEALHDTRLSLLAELARNYLELRGTQQRLDIAAQNIAAQADSVSITRSRYDAGLTSELDVNQAQALLAATQAQVPALEVAAAAAIHRIGVLAGTAPAALAPTLAPATPLPDTPPLVPVGLPSDLLRRRPDIRRTERELAAATARIGEAMADLFPKFSLTGNFGASAGDLSNFNLGSARFWSVGPSVQLPLFNAGSIRANIAVQNARQEAALAAYEQTVMRALEDVENALTAYAREQQRGAALAESVAANQRALEIAQELYTRGLSAFLNVLQAQDALRAAQDQLVQSRQLVLQNLVAVYKALGGGWEEAQLIADVNAEPVQ